MESLNKLSVTWNSKMIPSKFCTLFGTFRNVLTDRLVPDLAHRLRISLGVRRTNMILLFFGKRETTTSIMSDEQNVRAAREFHEKC